MSFVPKPANLDYWDLKDSFTVEELAYLFLNKEPQYEYWHPRSVKHVMETIFDTKNIFGISPMEDMQFSRTHNRYIRSWSPSVDNSKNPPKRKNKIYGMVLISTEDVTRYPRNRVRAWAAACNLLPEIPFLQTKDERDLAARAVVNEPSTIDKIVKPEQLALRIMQCILDMDSPQVRNDENFINDTTGVFARLPYMNRTLKALFDIMWNLHIDNAYQKNKSQKIVEQAIDKVFGYNHAPNGTSRDARAIAPLLKPDDYTGKGRIFDIKS
mgnify:CR=1 FL=1